MVQIMIHFLYRARMHAGLFFSCLALTIIYPPTTHYRYHPLSTITELIHNMSIPILYYFSPKARAAVNRMNIVPPPRSQPQPYNCSPSTLAQSILDYNIVPEVQTKGYSAGAGLVTITVYCLSLWGQNKILLTPMMEYQQAR